MGSHLDIIGSVIIAGMIILNFAFLMGERTESQIESSNQITAQTNVSDVTQTLRFDLRKTGFGCDSLPIIQATENTFIFRSDLANDGILDTIGYYFGGSALGSIENSESLLYRIVNGKKHHGHDLGLTSCRFVDYKTDKYGTLTETSSLGDIRAIGVKMRVRGQMKEDGKYPTSQNEFTVSPKNL
ncbi:MAG: hypothetical protein KFH87_12405 [Bacteroidetes bacterium]|nr:hypothetical protein [Bacteroidota bacterium]